MSNTERDVEKLQLSLAGAALSLLACEEKVDPGSPSLQAFSIAKLLGYRGAFEPAHHVRDWLRDFFTGPVAKRVAARDQEVGER